jgi:hypothetical protein
MTDLRALAEAATPGPWRAEKYVPSLDDDWTEGTYGWWVEGLDWADDSGEFRNFTGPNAAYIAAVSPDVVLALLDERDALRAALENIAADAIAALGPKP